MISFSYNCIRLYKLLINAICIDRGEYFRPVYRDVLNFRSLLVGVPVLNLTATCYGKVRKDVFKSLSLEGET